MDQRLAGLKSIIKTGVGIVVVAAIISGVFLYFTNRMNPIKYKFNPKNDYVYTFEKKFFTVEGVGTLQKKLGVLEEGFHPLCPFGCFKRASNADLKRTITHIPIGDEYKGSQNYVYLEAGDAIEIDLAISSGGTVSRRFPYLNRVILQIKGETNPESLKITARSYPYNARNSTPDKTSSTSTAFSYKEKFGDFSVYETENPTFADRVTIKLVDGDRIKLGIRWVNIYLARSEFIARTTRLASTLEEKSIDKSGAKELIAKLGETERLDPYSPKPESLGARIYQAIGDHERALSEINAAVDKAKGFSAVLHNEVKLDDLYKSRARAAGKLGDWNLAIDSMKKASPEVDHGFLSRAYLNLYKQTGNDKDFQLGAREAFLEFKDTPRFVLRTLRNFNESGLVDKALAAVDAVTTVSDHKIRLTTGETVSKFVLPLSTSLLHYWRDTDKSLSESLTDAKKAYELAETEEESALAAAILSMIFYKQGDSGQGNQFKEEATDYFSSYSNLYQDWLDALNLAGR